MALHREMSGESAPPAAIREFHSNRRGMKPVGPARWRIDRCDDTHTGGGDRAITDCVDAVAPVSMNQSTRPGGGMTTYLLDDVGRAARSAQSADTSTPTRSQDETRREPRRSPKVDEVLDMDERLVQ